MVFVSYVDFAKSFVTVGLSLACLFYLYYRKKLIPGVAQTFRTESNIIIASLKYFGDTSSEVKHIPVASSLLLEALLRVSKYVNNSFYSLNRAYSSGRREESSIRGPPGRLLV